MAEERSSLLARGKKTTDPYDAGTYAYDEESNALYGPDIDVQAQIRAEFVRKVYTILTLQLLVTLSAIICCLYVEGIKQWVQSHEWAVWSALILTFVVMIVLVCVPGLVRSHPANIILLGVFTLLESYVLGTISSFYSTDIVMMAVAITAIITCSLTLYVFVTKRDFSSWGPYLLVALLVLILFGIILLFVPNTPVLHAVYGCLGALIFSLFIVFDTSLLLKKLGPDDYIAGALSLYLDIINLFLYVLTILDSCRH
jgi:FtsH-binding integral membrane protein